LQPNQGHDYNGISSEDHHRNVGQTVCPMRHYQDSSSSHFNQGHGYPISDPAHYAHTLSDCHRYNQSSVMHSQQNQMPRSTREQGHGYAIYGPAHYAHAQSYNDRYNQSYVMHSQQNQMPRSTYEQGHGSAIYDPAHYAHAHSYNDRNNQTMANNDSTCINPTSSQLSYGASSAMVSQSNQSEVPNFSSAIHPSHANEKGYPISSSYPIAKDRECDADNPLNIKTPRIAHNSLPNPDYSRHDDLPHTIPIRTDGREIYMYMFHFKSQTSSIQATSITGEENMLITSLLKVNDFAIRDRISLSIDPKKSYQKIMLIRCRGMNRSPPTCCLQFLLIRTDGKLGFYVRMMNCKDASCHKIKHLVGCIPSKIKAPPDLIRNFDESGSGKDKVIHALVEHSTHSSANKKLRRALTQKTHKIKNGFVKAGNDCRATETVAEFKAYCENTGMCMSVEDYCALLKKEGYIHNNLKKIVVLAHDLDDAKDGRWNAVVFTTVGRLLVFMKIIEMAEWKKSITTQIDGTNLLDDIRFMVHGASDYKHQFFPLMFGIVREECKESATMVVRTSIQIFHNLGLKSEIAAHLLRHDILKDGGTALHATARELKLSERACKTHMIERTQGVGTKGQNGRGSMYVYLQNKQLKFKEDEYFFLLVNQSLFSVHGSKAYTTAVVMMFKYMLIDWVVRESGGEVKAFLKNDATEDDVIQVITEQFVCYIPFVSGDTKGDLVREHGGHLHKCEQIIAWFVGFYFRIGLCNSKDNENKSKYVLEPTFGPVHVPGDPFNTNGLESQNHVLQNHAKTVFGSHQVTKYQAALESIRPGSLVPDDLQTRPLHTDADWSNIWKYCEKKKLDVVPLPNYLRHAFIFDSNDPCPLINRADLFSKLGRLRKQHNTGNGIVIYLPSKENYERSMLAAKDSLREEANIGEYPMPPNACHNKTIKDEDRILGPLLDQLFIPQLLGTKTALLLVYYNEANLINSCFFLIF